MADLRAVDCRDIVGRIFVYPITARARAWLLWFDPSSVPLLLIPGGPAACVPARVAVDVRLLKKQAKQAGLTIDGLQRKRKP